MNSLNKQSINGMFGMCVTKTEEGKIVPCKNEDIAKIISNICKNIRDKDLYMDTDGTIIKLNKRSC